MIAESVSHYTILKKIGEGGMGEVYLAEDMSLGRNVALKILPADVTSDRDRLGRFKQEARAASALNHPNIITVHEIGESAGRHFISTEFIEGRTPLDTWGLAETYAQLGEKDEAFKWLEAGYEARFSWRPWIAFSSPLKSMHDDLRFEDLLRRINVPR